MGVLLPFTRARREELRAVCFCGTSLLMQHHNWQHQGTLGEGFLPPPHGRQQNPLGQGGSSRGGSPSQAQPLPPAGRHGPGEAPGPAGG